MQQIDVHDEVLRTEWLLRDRAYHTARVLEVLRYRNPGNTHTVGGYYWLRVNHSVGQFAGVS